MQESFDKLRSPKLTRFANEQNYCKQIWSKSYCFGHSSGGVSTTRPSSVPLLNIQSIGRILKPPRQYLNRLALCATLELFHMSDNYGHKTNLSAPKTNPPIFITKPYISSST